MATDLTTAIPKIVSARLRRQLEKKKVYAGRTNKSFQGELSQSGDRFVVNIVDRDTVTEGVYTDTTADSPTVVSYAPVGIGAAIEVAVDQQRYWSFGITDIQRVQVKPNLVDDAASIAANKIMDNVDARVKSVMEAGASMKIADTALDFSAEGGVASTVQDHAQAAQRHFDLNNVPAEGRWMIVGPMTREHINRSLTSKGYFTPGSAEMMALSDNYMGMLGKFQVFSSPINHGPGAKAGEFVEDILYGSDYAVCFVDQVSNTEQVRLESTFATGYRGLYTYGSKLLESTGLVKVKYTFSNVTAFVAA